MKIPKDLVPENLSDEDMKRLLEVKEKKPEDEGLEITCKYAVQVGRRRGDVICCQREKKFDEWKPLEDQLCVCSNLFWTGHATKDGSIDLEKMSSCEYRKPGKIKTVY